MNKKILYLARESSLFDSGGSRVDCRNLRTLQTIFGKSNVIIAYLPKTTIMTVAKSIITLSSYGVGRGLEKRVLQMQKNYQCDFVFIEGSFCGRLVKELTQQGCTVIMHMHNIEAFLYKERLMTEKTLISYIRYKFIKYNEKLSTKYASFIINLNDRDSYNLFREYGRISDIILPITFPKRAISLKSIKPGNYLLFVGSNFFPNIEGLIWFFSNVAPYIKHNIKVVGTCCQNELLRKVSIPINVDLVGYVDNLEEVYLEASAIIAPIFHGSGMKTKTVEAMSFGKTIIGTDEAFVGISDQGRNIGFKCNTAREFIDSINALDNNPINAVTLNYFNESFTDDVFRSKLENFLNYI